MAEISLANMPVKKHHIYGDYTVYCYKFNWHLCSEDGHEIVDLSSVVDTSDLHGSIESHIEDFSSKVLMVFCDVSARTCAHISAREIDIFNKMPYTGNNGVNYTVVFEPIEEADSM
jgi:hypothetical protein